MDWTQAFAIIGFLGFFMIILYMKSLEKKITEIESKLNEHIFFNPKK